MPTFRCAESTSFRRRCLATFTGPKHSLPLSRAGRLGRNVHRARIGSKHAIVCCAEPEKFTEASLKKMIVPELKEILRRNGIPLKRNSLKKDIITAILEHFRIAKEPVTVAEVADAEFDSHAELIESLNRFTMDELKAELKQRNERIGGRKMELVVRLASLMDIDNNRPTIADAAGTVDMADVIENIRTSLKNMDEMDHRIYLERKECQLNYHRYLNVKPIVYCYLVSEAIEKMEAFAQEPDQMLHMIDGIIDVVQIENEQTWAITEQCQELYLPMSERDTRDELLRKLRISSEEHHESIFIDSFSVKRGVKAQLNVWLREIRQRFAPNTSFDLDQTAADLAVPINAQNLQRKRCLTVLATELMQRVTTTSLSELAYALDFTQDQEAELSVTDAAKSFARTAFLKAIRIIFPNICKELLLRSTQPEMSDNMFDELETDRVPQLSIEQTDPTLTIGVVFSCSSTQAIDVFSGVRCLLDHLQTAPYPSQVEETGTASGMSVALYYIRVTNDRVHYYRLSAAEFLGLDVSTLDKSLSGIWSVGESVADFETLLSELKSLSMIIPLTSSLDAIARRNEDHLKELEQLDARFLGSAAPQRQLLNNRYDCLTYLRHLGFNIPPVYRIVKENLNDIESWSDGFNKWRNFYGVEGTDQQFYVHLFNSHERLGRQEVKGFGEIIASVKQAFEDYGMHEATIQPCAHTDDFAEFGCTVFETDEGPVALTPTEFEQLPSDYVRSLSSPLRCHAPPRFTTEKVQAMRRTAVRIFRELNLSGYACIYGRILFDPKAEHKLRNEELTYPRHLPPPDPESLEELALPREYTPIIKGIIQEKEDYYDSLIESYDTSSYTEETRKFLETMDAADAENGVVRNREKELEEYIDQLRTRKSRQRKLKRLQPLKYLMQRDLLEDFIASEADGSTAEVSTGPDYSIVVTGVDCNLTFAANSLIFQQAALSGLSHGAVLRHLFNLKLPETLQLSMEQVTAKQLHPLLSNFSPDTSDVRGSRTNQIWILCGGESTGHQASLLSAVNAMIKIKTSTKYDPFIFILDPGRRVKSSPEVLRGLHERRNALLEQGVPEDCLHDEVSRLYLNSPETIEYKVPWRPVWSVHYTHSLSSTIDDALEASERFRLFSNTSELAYDTLMIAFRDNLLATQRDLHHAGVQGVASLWGGEIDRVLPPPRMIPLDAFATEAAASGATVFIAVHGDIALDGSLQDFLSECKIPYTGNRDHVIKQVVYVCIIGCDMTTTKLCGDKYEAARRIHEVADVQNYKMKHVRLPELAECGQDMDKAKNFFYKVKGALNTSNDICIKPSSECFGGGVARISSVRDMYIYGKALKERWEMIEEGSLTEPHGTVVMPKPQAKEYTITHLMQPSVPIYDAAGRFLLPGGQRYIELSFGLVGGVGCMWVMNPSLVLSNLETSEGLEHRLFRGIKPTLTPIPDSLISTSSIQMAKRTVAKIADAIGLKGVARVDVFIDRRSGTLIVIEVDTTPYLGEHSLLFQQAVAEDPPMYPGELFQQILHAMEDQSKTAKQTTSSLALGDDNEQSDEMSALLSNWDEQDFFDTENTDVRAVSESSFAPKGALSNLWGSDDNDTVTDYSTKTPNA